MATANLLVLAAILVMGTEARQNIEGGSLWISGPWSGCEPLNPSIVNGSLMEAAIGIQSRNVTCVSPNGVVLHPSACLHVPTVQRGCVAKQRCQVGPWTPWETVEEGCIGDDEKIYPEIRRRSRKVLAAPLKSGQCPPLEETDNNADKRNLSLCSQKYKWLPSPWSRCQAINEAVEKSFVCGGGVQFRKASCVGASDSRPLPHFLCRGVARLPAVQQCEIPCDGDCQVSDWSPWSACHPGRCFQGDPAGRGSIGRPLEAFTRFIQNNTALSGYGYRIRYRRVVANASSRGVECPTLSEMQMCRSQFTDCYAWKPRPLETCLLHGNDSKCGAGSRDFVYHCLHYTGQIADDSFCSGLPLPSVENQTRCHVTCPEECALSEWSEWGSCVSGKRHRSRILIGLPENPKTCTETSRLHQVENCTSSVDRNWKFHWLALPWSECVIDEGSSCGTGYQLREVQCIRDDTQHVLDEWCTLLEKPVEHRFCHVSCPQPCIVSQWSPWSSCDSQKEQSRYRLVLTQSAFDESTCPPLTEKRVCSNSQEIPYKIAVRPWTRCRPTSNIGCGNGYRTRAIECWDSNNRLANISSCLDWNFDEISRIPLVEECSIQCDELRCEFSQWSQWTRCSKNCGGVRNKRRTVIGPEGKLDICQKRHVTQVAEECPCISVTRVADDDWTRCFAIENDCGRGKQYRRQKCYDKTDNSTLPIQWCGDAEYEEKDCHVPCPVDCQLSSWSPWAPCNSTCGPGVQRRSRKIETEAGFGGRPCGPLEEMQPCNTHPCQWYQWHASPWSPCLMTGQCGNSIQHRKVQCINEFENAIVSDSLCDAEVKPSTFRHCHVSCPGECVVSEWSPWSSCITCSGSRRRNRWIIRQPIGNQSCPVLEDVEPCSSDLKNCWTFQWRTTEWSSCLPLGGSTCGEGIRTRIAYCARTDGRMVDENFCDVHTKPSVTEKWCNIECPIDCRLSSWSLWDDSQCISNYTTGKRLRRREIEILGNAYGRECRQLLIESIPCPANPQFQWKWSQWSNCNLQGTDCGQGIQRRKLICSTDDIHHDRQEIIDFCQVSSITNNPDNEDEQSCHVLCPLEKQIKVVLDEHASDGTNPQFFENDEVHIRYYPNDDEFNIWMVAMIVIGSLFLVFVGATIILICTSKTETVDAKRHITSSQPECGGKRYL